MSSELISWDVAPRDVAAGLRIGGLEKLSLVDWPGRLCAVVFCQGCAWRCRYCHNPHLLPFAPPGALTWEEVVTWLHRRRGLLDGVVFSGGEPLWQPRLLEAMQTVRSLDFAIGLHTGGPAPARIEPLLPLLAWVGFDFKAPFSAYARLTGRDDGEAAAESLRLLRAAAVPCEIRTTWHPHLLTPDDLEAMADALLAIGCREWVIQRFRPDGCDDEELRCLPVGAVPLERLHRPGLNIQVR